MNEEMEGYIPSEIILDLYENPINYGILPKPDIKLIADNLGCGDHIIIHIKLSKNTIKNIKYTFEGSVISKAGASIATDLILNKSIDFTLSLKDKEILEKVGGVIETRQKCLLFALNVIKKGLVSYLETKSKKPFTLKLKI